MGITSSKLTTAVGLGYLFFSGASVRAQSHSEDCKDSHTPDTAISCLYAAVENFDAAFPADEVVDNEKLNELKDQLKKYLDLNKHMENNFSSTDIYHWIKSTYNDLSVTREIPMIQIPGYTSQETIKLAPSPFHRNILNGLIDQLELVQFGCLKTHMARNSHRNWSKYSEEAISQTLENNKKYSPDGDPLVYLLRGAKRLSQGQLKAAKKYFSTAEKYAPIFTHQAIKQLIDIIHKKIPTNDTKAGKVAYQQFRELMIPPELKPAIQQRSAPTLRAM